MYKDKYALEVERTIYNWYYGGENAAPEPMFNALHTGIANDMQMLVPIETPEAMLENMGDPSKLKPGDTFSNNEDIHIRFRHLVAEGENQYFIPLFTSDEMMNIGEPTSAMLQPLKELFASIELWPDCLGFIINPWQDKLILSKDMIKMILDYHKHLQIELVRGSVVDMHVGAIVNAANTSLLGGGGVDGAIHAAAGKDLLAECETLNGCETGKAKITGAYNIKYADYIIHTVGPIYSGESTDAKLLSACYTNSLNLALKNGCSSIAFPGISTGIYGYPLDKAATVSLLSVLKWFDKHPDAVMNVYFCCFNDNEFETYQELGKRIHSQSN